MFRLISILLLLGGAAVAGFGGWMMYSGQIVQPDVSIDVEAPPPLPEAEVIVEAVDPAAPIASRSLGGESTDDNLRVAPAAMPALDNEPIFGTSASATSSIMDKLQRVPIAHETPVTAQFGKSFEVTIAIDATGDDSAADALPGTGIITEGEARVSDSVKALVTGANFQIETLSPDVQELSPLTENVWRWKVTPLENGSHDLTIELYAMIGDKALPVRTYRDTVTVEISRLRQAVVMAQDANPLTMLLGGIGSVLAGLFGAARFFKGS